jgi:hypothetical protein
MQFEIVENQNGIILSTLGVLQGRAAVGAERKVTSDQVVLIFGSPTNEIPVDLGPPAAASPRAPRCVRDCVVIAAFVVRACLRAWVRACVEVVHTGVERAIVITTVLLAAPLAHSLSPCSPRRLSQALSSWRRLFASALGRSFA